MGWRKIGGRGSLPPCLARPPPGRPPCRKMLIFGEEVPFHLVAFIVLGGGLVLVLELVMRLYPKTELQMKVGLGPPQTIPGPPPAAEKDEGRRSRGRGGIEAGHRARKAGSRGSESVDLPQAVLP